MSTCPTCNGPGSLALTQVEWRRMAELNEEYSTPFEGGEVQISREGEHKWSVWFYEGNAGMHLDDHRTLAEAKAEAVCAMVHWND
jgi:hypothetical protein